VQVPSNQMPNYNNWVVPDTVVMPASTSVIAVQLANTDHCGSAGFIASNSNNCVFTNSAWRCTAVTPTSDWMTVGYDDFLWPPAVQECPNGQAIWGSTQLGYVSASAYWIWTTNGGCDLEIYCRLNI